MGREGYSLPYTRAAWERLDDLEIGVADLEILSRYVHRPVRGARTQVFSEHILQKPPGSGRPKPELGGGIANVYEIALTMEARSYLIADSVMRNIRLQSAEKVRALALSMLQGDMKYW